MLFWWNQTGVRSPCNSCLGSGLCRTAAHAFTRSLAVHSHLFTCYTLLLCLQVHKPAKSELGIRPCQAALLLLVLLLNHSAFVWQQQCTDYFTCFANAVATERSYIMIKASSWHQTRMQWVLICLQLGNAANTSPYQYVSCIQQLHVYVSFGWWAGRLKHPGVYFLWQLFSSTLDDRRINCF